MFYFNYHLYNFFTYKIHTIIKQIISLLLNYCQILIGLDNQLININFIYKNVILNNLYIKKY